MFTSHIRTGKKCDLSDFVNGMLVVGRWAGLIIFAIANLRDLHTKHSPLCTQNGAKNKKHPTWIETLC